MQNGSAPKKRGQLSLEEEKFISENFGTISEEQIADKLNRNVGPIKKFINEHNECVIKPAPVEYSGGCLDVLFVTKETENLENRAETGGSVQKNKIGESIKQKEEFVI